MSRAAGTPASAITFGVLLPIGRRRELSAGSSEERWARLVAFARSAEQLGYDSLWVYDHLQNVPEPATSDVFESWTVLTALSQHTTRIRLGHLVGNNLLRAPSLVAKMAATLDVVSSGRLEFGLGAGWERRELEAYGYSLPAPGERIGRLEEALEIVRSLWTQPESMFAGSWYRLDRAQCDPKPLQRPHPPIWIGGSGERRTLRVVARYADVSNFGGTVDEWARKCDVLKGHCADIGRDYESITKTWSHDVFVRERAAEVTEAGSLDLWGKTEDRWRDENLVGTPEHVAEKVARFVDHGCRGFVVWCADAPSHRTLELFAERVIPDFR